MLRAQQASRQARRRRLIADGLDRLGIALCIGLGIGLGAMIVSRLIGEPLDWRIAVLPPVALAAILALADAWRRRLTELEAATDLDTALRLRDKIGSSLELGDLDRNDPFVQLLERDAEETARSIKVAEATPISLGNAWLAWPTLAALVIVATLYMPTLDLLGRQRAAHQRAEEAAQVEEASQTIEELIEQAKQDFADLDPSPEEQNDLSDLLEEIQEQLKQGDITPEEAEALAAAALDEQASELQQQAEEAQQQSDLVKELLAESADPDNLDASELEQALESGDFDAASEALQKLQQELSEMSDEQRQALSESMSEMAQRLSQAAQNRQSQNNAAQRMSEQLQQMGLSKELAEQLAQSGDAQQISEQLQQQGLDPETAKQLAEQMARQKNQSDCEGGACRSAESLAKALKQASKGAAQGDAGEMGELGEALGGMSDAELESELAALKAGEMSGQAQGIMQSKGGGVGGNKAGEGTDYREQLPSALGKSFTEDVEARKGGGAGEVAMRYTRDRPVDWDEGASSAPMRAAKIREAAEAAERAMEEQAISPRYRHVVRKFYERARQVAPPAGEEPAKPAEPADQGSK